MSALDTVLSCPEALAPWVEAHVLDPSDVHVAVTLCRLAGVDDPDLLLATAMAARAPRAGHTCLDVDLGVPPTDDDVDLSWPEPDVWLAAIAASPLASADDGGVTPLLVEGRRVYLRRYRDHEQAVATDLTARCVAAANVDEELLADCLTRLFPDAPDDDPQRRAAEAAVRGRLTVVAGGPGTGKTWTVARILAALAAQAHGAGSQLRIALAAPTGKAAARLDDGVRSALASMDVDDDVRARVADVERGRTLHALLGRRSASRFWHDRDRPLPYDVVVVDEMSMASVSLAARLLDAIPPHARVVLVGDPDQLASVEAGTVLGDVVGSGRDTRSAGGGLAERVVTLTQTHRFGSDTGIGALAGAIRSGDAEAVLDHLGSHDDLAWHDSAGDVAPDDVRAELVDRGRRTTAAARDGDGRAALAALSETVVLCGHRNGPEGVAGWNARVDGWLADAVDGWRLRDLWQPGQAVLATRNDRQLQVFNGDIGVVIATPDGVRVDFHGDRDPDRAPISPVRLEDLESVHAMTIHKSQGSQWDHVVVVLPATPSRIVTRELLYTAVTRAAERVTVIGTADTIRHAVQHPIARASGLGDRLWGPCS